VILYNAYKSGDTLVEFIGNDDKYTVKVNGAVNRETDNFADAITDFYTIISHIIDSHTKDKDLALNIFGNKVVMMNRAILPRLARLGRMSEVKMLEAINYKTIFKSRLAKESNFGGSIGGGFVSTPGYSNAAMTHHVPLNTDSSIAPQADGSTPSIRPEGLKKKKRLDEFTIELKSELDKKAPSKKSGMGNVIHQTDSFSSAVFKAGDRETRDIGVRPYGEEFVLPQDMPPQPIKVDSTYIQRKGPPDEQQPIEGGSMAEEGDSKKIIGIEYGIRNKPKRATK
jgi:hypothetical protein